MNFNVFKKQVKMLCEKNELSEELISLIKQKHLELEKTDPSYLKSSEFLFLREFFSEERDILVLNYFKQDILNDDSDETEEAILSAKKKLGW